MKTYLTLALLATLSLPTLAMADDTPAGVAGDVQAVQKDNADIAKQNSNLAQNRAKKAADKANGNIGSQAVDSVKIGANKLGKSEKETEKSSDQQTLKDDVNSAASK